MTCDSLPAETGVYPDQDITPHTITMRPEQPAVKAFPVDYGLKGCVPCVTDFVLCSACCCFTCRSERHSPLPRMRSGRLSRPATGTPFPVFLAISRRSALF